MFIHTEGVLPIDRKHGLTQRVPLWIGLLNLVYLPKQEVGERITCIGAVEREVAVGVSIGQQVPLQTAHVDTERHLVTAAGEIEVVGGLVGVHVEPPWRTGAASR